MNHTPSDVNLFNDLFSKHKERFVRFAVTYVRDRSTAENLVIDSFVYYWEHRADIHSTENLSAYILTVVKHKCLNHIRREKLSANISDRLRSYIIWDQNARIASLEACDPKQLFSQEIHQIVDRTLAGLPAQTRRIFNMSRLDNLPQKEIARLCGMTVKGVEFHIGTALKALRKTLEDYYLPFVILFLNF